MGWFKSFGDDTNTQVRNANGTFGMGGAGRTVYNAVKSYTGFGFGAINGMLRGNTIPYQLERTQAEAKAIHAGMKPMAQDTTLYRRMNLDALPNVKVGDTYTDKGFTSTSTSLAAASIEVGTTIVTISVPAGTPALDVTAIGGAANPDLNEQEVILDSNQTYRVDAVGDGTLSMSVVHG